MMYEEFFRKLEENPPPEITTAPLTRLVLSAKLANVFGGLERDAEGKNYMTPKEMFAETLNPPNEEEINRAILSLKAR